MTSTNQLAERHVRVLGDFFKECQSHLLQAQQLVVTFHQDGNPDDIGRLAQLVAEWVIQTKSLRSYIEKIPTNG